MRNPVLFIYGHGNRTLEHFAWFGAVQKVSGPPVQATVVVTRVDGGQRLERPVESWKPWPDQLQGVPGHRVVCADGDIECTDRGAMLDGQAKLEPGAYCIQLVSAAGDSNIEHFYVHSNGFVSWTETALDAVRLDFLSLRPFETRLGLEGEPDILARVINPDEGFFGRELFSARLLVDGVAHTWNYGDVIFLSSVPSPGAPNTCWWSLDDWSLRHSDLTPGRHRAFLLFGGLRSNECIFEV